MASSINSLYMLTEMTGRRSNEGRTMVLSGFEMKNRHFWIAVFSVGPGLMLMLLLMPAIGQWSVLVPVLTGIVGFILAEARSRTGLKERLYKDLIAKSKANLGKFVLCGHPIEVHDYRFGRITRTAAPLTPPTETGRIIEFGTTGITGATR